MSQRRVTFWVWTCGLPLLLACGGRDTTTNSTSPETQTDASAAPEGADAALGGAGDGDGSAPTTSSLDAGVRSDGSTPPAGDDAEGGISEGDASSKPGFPDGAISRPGQYEGFSEKIYDGYELSSEYVAVRDGTKLAVDLYRPKTADGKVVESRLPVLFMHTPYNRRYFGSPTTGMGLSGESYPGAAARLVPYGYVVAIADFRGVYASYGENEGYNRGEWVDAAHLDAYDLIEWFASQSWATDSVGMWGCSATGGSQMQTATTAPPHLKAVFPMSCEFDAYPFGVPGGMAPPEGTDTKAPPGGGSASLRDATAVAVDGDTLRQQLAQAIAEHQGGVENPGYVPFRDSVAENIPEVWWLKSSPHTYLQALKDSGIAFYVAANWNEAATKYGAFFSFKNLAPRSKLIVGPAGHCAWFTVEKETGFDISIEELRFFDHHLKGIENGVSDEPRVYYYTYNEADDLTWRSASQWPLPDEQRTAYYLGEGRLDPAAPQATDATDQAVVDYTATAENLAGGLRYETEPLTNAVRVTGHPVVELWISSTATDGDFVATLQDVSPDGTATSYEMQGRLRASLRSEGPAPYDNLGLPWHPMGASDVQPLKPGEPTRLRFDLLPMSVRFASGHRIRLVLTFADSATPQVQPAPTVSVYRDVAHPSTITLPIIPD